MKSSNECSVFFFVNKGKLLVTKSSFEEFSSRRSAKYSTKATKFSKTFQRYIFKREFKYVLIFHKRVEFPHVLIRIFLLLRINFLVFEYKF